MSEDKADIAEVVEIEIHPFKLQFSNQTYPHPTREDIYIAAREYLEANIFSYSEKRITHNEKINNNFQTVNEEPISAPLETFKDIENMIDNALGKTVGRASKEQGGNREGKSYNTERDPFNE